MEYSPINPDEEINSYSQHHAEAVSGYLGDGRGLLINSSIQEEPLQCKKIVDENIIQCKELLINALEGKEIIPIDNIEYKNEEIDEIIKKIESFPPKFLKLQNELNEIFKEYNLNSEITEKNIITINETIDFIGKIKKDYQIDPSNENLITQLNDYIKRITNNNKLKESKEKYIQKRKELNSYLYFIQKINKWNISNMCPICLTNRTDSYCNPCGHTACKECLQHNTLSNNNNNNNNFNSNKCPICREYISEIRKLYFI